MSESLQPQELYTLLGILQARILEWVAVPFSRESPQLRDRTQVSHIADSLPAEPPGKPKNTGVSSLSLLQGIFSAQKSPALQMDSLTPELSGKPKVSRVCASSVVSDSLWPHGPCQGPLSPGFPKQEYWSGLSFSLQGICPTQGSNPVSYIPCFGRQILYH